MTASSKTFRYALAGALAGVLLAGTAYAGNPGKDAARYAEKAQAALAKGQAEKAVDHAQEAVEAKPGDAGMRALLGYAYLRAGRFESAALTLDEARQLGDNDTRTVLGLALAQVGRGQFADAVALLDASRDRIGADDLGLAYALAGETGRGVAILSDAVRAGEPTAKLRQNLAYAYALDNRWREARIMMMMDVPAGEIDDRISDWAGRARPEAYRTRVAALLGVPVVSDSGRPDRLALVTAAPAQQVTVTEEPAPAPAAELPALADKARPADLASTTPAEAAPTVQTIPAAESFASAFTAAPMPPQPMVQPVRARPTSAAATATRPAEAKAPAGPPTGRHLVQLGSFSSEANARRAWTVFTARNPSLRNYGRRITPVVVRGKNFWRVSAEGLSASAARSLCSSVKSQGRGCFAYAAGQPMKTGAARYAVASAGQRARR